MLIYISYNHQSLSYVKKLYNSLRKHGMDAWYADLVGYGDDLNAAMDRKQKECDAVIFLMTPEAVTSPPVQAELEGLTRLGKKIYPFLLKDLNGNQNPFSQLRYVDVRDDKLPPKRFYEQLAALRLPGDSTLDAPPPEKQKKKGK